MEIHQTCLRVKGMLHNTLLLLSEIKTNKSVINNEILYTENTHTGRQADRHTHTHRHTYFSCQKRSMMMW